MTKPFTKKPNLPLSASIKGKFVLYILGLVLYLSYMDPGLSVLWENLLKAIPQKQVPYASRHLWVAVYGIIGIWGLSVFLNAPIRWVRRIAWPLFWIASLINFVSVSVTGDAFNVLVYDIVVSEFAHTFSFLNAVYQQILWALFKGLVATGLFYAFFKYLKLPRNRSLKVVSILTLACVLANLIRYKAVVFAVPSAFAVPSSVVYKHATATYYGPRNVLTKTPTESAVIDHIILIVDETVRDDYLTLNNPALDTAPYLASIPLVNYGRGLAATNSSRHSNTLLRTGLRPHQIPDKTFESARVSNIFQFAQKAGFKTYYANAQRTGNSFDNFMNKFDMPFIDVFENVGSTGQSPNFACGDQPVADFILKSVKIHEKSFVYVNKMGNHFPYASQYPESKAIYKPALESWENQVGGGEKTINAYKNSMRWNVDEFFKYLLKGLHGKNYLIIYVSDHGEEIENAASSRSLRAVSGKPDDVRIAFLVLSDRTSLLKQFREKLPSKFNAATHFDVFPTLLWAMGYNKNWVYEHFGPSLLTTENYLQQFLVGSIHHHSKWESARQESPQDQRHAA